MAAVKIVLRDQKKDGTYPVTIRITKNRKSTYVYLDQCVKLEDWNEELQQVRKSHPNHKRFNNFLLAKLAEAKNTALEMETNKNQVSAKTVKQKIKPTAGANFASQAELYLKNLKASGKFNRYSADKPRIKHFLEFLPGNDIAFSEITAGLLEQFKVYLKANRKVSERTIMNHLVLIRSVFSLAIKNQVADAKYYPFGKGKISIKFPDSTKVGIGKEDVKKLENVELDDPAYDHARNLWLISYYFAGMRISDVLRLRWSDFRETRLHYKMGKNNKSGSLKTPEKALKILSKYEQFKENENDLIFPELKVVTDWKNNFDVQHKIAKATASCDRYLKNRIAPKADIKGKLTMHIARHTFATNAADVVSVQTLQKMYRHNNITTTMGYMANFINKETDDALDAVLGL